MYDKTYPPFNISPAHKEENK